MSVIVLRGKCVSACGRERVDVLDAGAHEINGAFEEPDNIVDLAGAFVGVLPAWVHVEGGPAAGVEAKEELFASEGLGLDVFGGEGGVETILVAPCEGGFEAFYGLLDVVFCCADVAQDAFVRLGQCQAERDFKKSDARATCARPLSGRLRWQSGRGRGHNLPARCH